ncbi:MAG: DUF6368 family protein [Thermoanaerobaculia bacterium]
MGPTSSIVLPGSPEAHRSRVLALVHLIASSVEGDDFWVSSTFAIGGAYRGEGRPFCFTAEALAEYDEDELAEIEARFGFRPTTDIGLAAMCDRREDHRILCELSIAVADQFGGVIDFGGELMVPKQPLEGQLESMPYVAANGSGHTYHVGDSTFARAWLTWAKFHMVK